MMTNVVHRAIWGTEVYEIFGCGKIPAERLSERLRVAIVPLVEQEEFVALAKWHAVTEPSARGTGNKASYLYLSSAALPFARQSSAITF